MADGYDGIVLRDEEFGGEGWVAFRPTQIKSATGNTGDFDADSPDIRLSRRAELAQRAANEAAGPGAFRLPEFGRGARLVAYHQVRVRPDGAWCCNTVAGQDPQTQTPAEAGDATNGPVRVATTAEVEGGPLLTSAP